MIEFHPLANIFPLIEGQEFADLVSDIRAHGVLDPIVLLGKQILDGRNRYRAAVEAKVLPESLDELTVTHLKHFKQLVPAGAPEPSQKDLLDFVTSKNLHRRQLNDDQRRMVGGRLVNLRQGRPSEENTSQIANISRDDAAKLLATDVAGIDRARSVLAHGVREIVELVDEGKVTVAAAAEIAQQPAERQAEIVASLPRDAAGKLTPEAKKALAPIVKEIRAEKQGEKSVRRNQREERLGKAQRALPDERFGVIYADPEWRFETYSRETGMDRAADNHYPTSETDAICARPVKDIAADDCVLFLWATVPMLSDALRVMAAWGFSYKSHAVWWKGKAGTGYWFRNEHELLLVGTKGKIPAPAMGTQLGSVFNCPVGEHSVKPDAAYEMIEHYFPSLPKIELNARRARDGWKSWGNEATPAETEAAA